MFIKRSKILNQKGQALLIIILVMVVALTVGLSLATRTIINLRNTTEQASSQKALSAAEAGIEQAIKQNLTGHLDSPTNFQTSGAVTSYSTTVSQETTSQPFMLNGPNGAPVQKSDAIYVWVSPPTDNFNTPWTGQFSVYWGENSGNCTNAALEIAVIYNTKENPLLKRYAYDESGCTRITSNNFSAATKINTVISGKTLRLKANLNLTNVLLIRINPIYQDTLIGVFGNPSLAVQGKTITSIGTADNTTTRKITVFEGYPEVPAEFFPYILFSPR